MKEIFELARSISSVLDVDALLKRIGTTAEELLDAEASSVMLLDGSGEYLVFKAASGEKGGIVQKMKVKVGQGIAGTAAAEKKPLVVNDTSKDRRFDGEMDYATGYVTRSIACVPMFIDNELVGVMEVLNKRGKGGFTAEDTAILESLASLAAVSINNARIMDDQRNFFVNVIELLSVAIEARDPRLAGHSWKVAQAATAVGRRMGIKDQEYRSLYYGALLHDIGLLTVKDNVTISEGIVTGRDLNPERNHPRAGANLVRNINLLKGASVIIRHHHENYDGTGYPDGLAGDKIPLGARIVAVAEAAEEMRLSGIPDDKIVQMLKLGQETRFDPEVVAVYIKEFSEAATH